MKVQCMRPTCRQTGKDCATVGSFDSNHKQICTTTASVTATECLIVVPTTLVSTAPKKSSAVGSSTRNGGGWLSLSQNILTSITVPLETSPAKYKRGNAGPE
eukprot:2315463-Pleurochrysis_carterae.AAC.2